VSGSAHGWSDGSVGGSLCRGSGYRQRLTALGHVEIVVADSQFAQSGPVKRMSAQSKEKGVCTHNAEKLSVWGKEIASRKTAICWG
jgi:hypothetical protein